MHFNVRFEDDFSFIFGIKINSMTSMVYRGRSGGRFVIQKLVFENMFCDAFFIRLLQFLKNFVFEDNVQFLKSVKKRKRNLELSE